MNKIPQTLFILCGEAFSGKSTLSKKISEWCEAKVVGRDVLYFATEKILALENTPDEDDELLWRNLWPLVLLGVRNQLSLGHSVVIDDNCFRLARRDELRTIAETMGIKNTLIYLDTPTEILKERKEKNKILKERHDVPSAWMEEDAQIFERPRENENPIVYKPSESLDDFVDKFMPAVEFK